MTIEFFAMYDDTAINLLGSCIICVWLIAYIPLMLPNLTNVLEFQNEIEGESQLITSISSFIICNSEYTLYPIVIAVTSWNGVLLFHILMLLSNEPDAR